MKRLLRRIAAWSQSNGRISPIRWASTVRPADPPAGCRDQTASGGRSRHRGGGGGVLSGECVSAPATTAAPGLRRRISGKPNPPSPPEANVKVRYPAMIFGGRIIYSRTVHEVDQAAREILDAIEAQKQSMDNISLGFDLEWRPSFIQGKSPGKAAVMQICVDPDNCYVMHIFHSGIPPNLRELLENRLFIKVGVSIASDARKILRDYDVQVRDLEDLSGLANLKFGGATKIWGLNSLTEKLVGKQLKKHNIIRLGNWETDMLSREQLDYAATDAFVSWHLYQVLRSFPDATQSDGTVKVDGIES